MTGYCCLFRFIRRSVDWALNYFSTEHNCNQYSNSHHQSYKFGVYLHWDLLDLALILFVMHQPILRSAIVVQKCTTTGSEN